MICSNCEKEITESAAFCPYCGTKTFQPVQPSIAPEPPVMPDVQPVPQVAPPVPQVAPPVPQVAPPVPQVAPPVPQVEPPVPQVAPPVPQVETPVQPDINKPAAQYRQTEAFYKEPVPDNAQKPRKMQEKKEKEFFGVGAFIFCLLIIALLAGAAGMFAYKYFALLGVI